jgi:hydroxymethylpyrimidine/phosphomethylpyrimidine kinase
MSVICARIDFELLYHCPAEPVLREHPPHRRPYHLIRSGSEPVLEALLFDVADIPGMMIILFILKFVAGDLYLVGIDNDYKIPRIDVRSKNRLVLASQTICNLAGHPSQYNIFGVNEVPFPLDFIFFCKLRRLHCYFTFLNVRKIRNRKYRNELNKIIEIDDICQHSIQIAIIAHMKTALTIAGSDPTGGAGLQSDIRVFGHLGVHGLSVATALTAQNTSGVDAIFGVEASVIEAQLNSLLNDIRPDALKTGMLYSKAAIRVIVRVIKGFELENLVIDPVTVSSSGRLLMEDGALDLIRAELFPLAKVITPNIYEASALSGINVTDEESMEKAALALKNTGPETIIITGGHLERETLDLILHDGKFYKLRAKKVPGEFHGTGCAFSAAIAAYLARESSVVHAAEKAKAFMHEAIIKAHSVGKGMKLLDV